MSWSVAVIVIVVLVFLGSIALALVDVRGKVAKEEAKGNAEGHRGEDGP